MRVHSRLCVLCLGGGWTCDVRRRSLLWRHTSARCRVAARQSGAVAASDRERKGKKWHASIATQLSNSLWHERETCVFFLVFFGFFSLGLAGHMRILRVPMPLTHPTLHLGRLRRHGGGPPSRATKQSHEASQRLAAPRRVPTTQTLKKIEAQRKEACVYAARLLSSPFRYSLSVHLAVLFFAPLFLFRIPLDRRAFSSRFAFFFADQPADPLASKERKKKERGNRQRGNKEKKETGEKKKKRKAQGVHSVRGERARAHRPHATQRALSNPRKGENST
nr:hypothetical protein [Pandoravirus aubagnensis]